MYQVIVRKGRKVVQKLSFSVENDAWDFFEAHRIDYICEFRDCSILKAI